jgi:hypothetical protein
MTKPKLKNISTETSPISNPVADRILSDFLDLYGTERGGVVRWEDDNVWSLTDPTMLIKFSAWWLRTGGRYNKEENQILTGWSKIEIDLPEAPKHVELEEEQDG